ncbi:MAG: GNAT family N-acetyltransferase [Nanoarchaeota archaeon]|nr:GNAT family N-acetyltransferase [Nanoarchaeota archaeon]
MKLRKFKKEDARKLSYLIRKALTETNINDYSKKVIDYLYERNSPAHIVDRAKIKLTYVAVDGDKVIGTGNLEGNEINTVFVNPKYHGKGIGRKIMEHLEEIAKKKGYKSIKLPASVTAKRFYEKLGYKKVKDQYSKKFGKTILMKKFLK